MRVEKIIGRLRPAVAAITVNPADELRPLGPESESDAKETKEVNIGNVNYYDFVFGRVLGSGALATVRWAKKITRNVPDSQWKEYAVKVIEKKRIEDLNYAGT